LSAAIFLNDTPTKSMSGANFAVSFGQEALERCVAAEPLINAVLNKISANVRRKLFKSFVAAAPVNDSKAGL
jgi:hypothetical protein